MFDFLYKYYRYLFLLIFLYLLLNLFRNIFNIYTFLIIIFILIYFYKKNKILFKKTIYKLIFKKKRFSFKNKFGAAINSLESIEEINKKIINKVDAELLKFEKNKLSEQLKYGDYKVILFGAGSSGKTSIARALLKNLIGKISPTIGTTKNITSYKIRIPILKRNINIVDTPGLFESSQEGEQREKSTMIEATKSDLILFVIDHFKI